MVIWIQVQREVSQNPSLGSVNYKTSDVNQVLNSFTMKFGIICRRDNYL